MSPIPTHPHEGAVETRSTDFPPDQAAKIIAELTLEEALRFTTVSPAVATIPGEPGTPNPMNPHKMVGAVPAKLGREAVYDMRLEVKDAVAAVRKAEADFTADNAKVKPPAPFGVEINKPDAPGAAAILMDEQGIPFLTLNDAQAWIERQPEEDRQYMKAYVGAESTTE